MFLISMMFHYTQNYLVTITHEEQTAINQTDNLAKILVLPVWNIDYDTVDRIIAVSAQFEPILRIYVEEPTGTIISQQITNATAKADKIITRNIMYNDQLLGRVTAHLSFDTLREAQQTDLFYHMAFLAALLIILLIVTHAMLTLYLRRPLEQLRGMINQLRIGEYQTSYAPPETGELRSIAENFVAMANEVATREHDLTQINSALEQQIEERKRIEQELRASQEQFSLVAASTMDGITDLTPNSTTISYTARWKELTGYSDEELTNSLATWVERIHPDDREGILEISTGKNIDNAERHEREYRFMHKDGTYRWLLGRTLAIRDEHGEVSRIIGIHSDVTAKKMAAQRLLATKEMLQNVIDDMPSLIIGFTEKLLVSLWNTNAEATTGITAEEAIGKPFSKLFPELSYVERHVQQALSEQKTITVPKVTSMRSGAPLTYDIVIFPVCEGAKARIFLRIDDITEKLRMEEMIIQTEKMASISGLAAGMAHEINNPLGGILQGVQNVQRRFSPDLAPNIKVAGELGCSLQQIGQYMERREIFSLLDGIAESGKRAASIIANMLEFSRGAGVKRVSVNIHDVIEKSIELASNDYSLRKQQRFTEIEIVREYGSTVSQITCSPQEIEQVLLNLFKNAAQAMASATPPIQHPKLVITTEQTSSGVAISVADNGPGMEEDVRKRIFEPFYTTKEVGEGTGLGLSVSYFIITNNHSGTISVTAAKDQGTTFNINLPAAI
ncbi:MAG: PAS domain S-box protein [Desulfovibrionales bacterium]|nr:PAS domain S-box protein [Desulfovibrionales bacterium]